MSRSLESYGVGRQFEGIVLEDPALFDSLVIRMTEDLELAVQVAALGSGLGIVNGNIAGATLSILGVLARFSVDQIPVQMRRSALVTSRNVTRGPLDYEDGALELVGDAVAMATYSYLTIGAQNARVDGSQVVKLRHYLPACESWPYPLNRFC
jgi:hypothetical protein